MAKNCQMGVAAVNAQADALARLCDSGYFRVYTGTQPTDGNTAIGAQVLLVEVRWAVTCAPAASGGVVAFADSTQAVIVATGAAAWFRVLKSDGTTPVFDGSVGVSSANLILTTDTMLTIGKLFVVQGYTHTLAKATAGS